MPKSHRAYPPEFRARLVELVRKGRTPEELGRQFEPSAQAIRNYDRAETVIRQTGISLSLLPVVARERQEVAAR